MNVNSFFITDMYYKNMDALIDKYKYSIKTEKNYPIIVCDNSDKRKFFAEYLNKFVHNKIDNSKLICIDLEFNGSHSKESRYIGLIQVMLVNHGRNIIFILGPKILKNKKIINDLFLTDIIKIFHGSDSLDVPYIYKDILKYNSKKIVKFTKNLVDTRFLCEYYKIMDRQQKIRCNIYQALFDFQVIDETKFNSFLVHNKKIDYRKNWYIKKLTEDQIKYAAYDVYHLDILLNNIIVMFNRNFKNESIDLVNPIINTFLLNKFGIFNTYQKAVDGIKKINPNKIEKIDDLIKDVFIEKYQLKINNILQIDTIRKVILNIMRYNFINNKDLMINIL